MQPHPAHVTFTAASLRNNGQHAPPVHDRLPAACPIAGLSDPLRTMLPMSGSLDRYRTMATDDLADAYRQVGGLVRAAEAQRLQILAVLDEREAHRADGCVDAAQWVAATDNGPTRRRQSRRGHGPGPHRAARHHHRRRVVPDKMREHLRQRDRCCRWNGCSRTRGLRAHHIDHWIADGETEERNCVMLCRVHHALVHEGGWTITGDPTTNDLHFHRPACGTTIPVAPAPAHPDLRKRYGLDAA